jgi:hypothetical protein
MATGYARATLRISCELARMTVAPADMRPSDRSVWVAAAVAILVSGLCFAGIAGIGAMPYPLELDLAGLDKGLAQMVLAVVGCLAATVALASASSGLFRRRRILDAVLGALALFGSLGVGVLALILGWLGVAFGSGTTWVDLGATSQGRHLVVQTYGLFHRFARVGELNGVVVRPIGDGDLPDDAAPIGGAVRVADDGSTVTLRWAGDDGGVSIGR